VKILYFTGYFTQEGIKTLFGYVLTVSFGYGMAQLMRGKCLFNLLFVSPLACKLGNSIIMKSAK